MSVQTIKLMLAALGLLLFFASVRLENATFRWIAIALIATSYLLRFYRPHVPDSEVTTRVEEQ